MNGPLVNEIEPFSIRTETPTSVAQVKGDSQTNNLIHAIKQPLKQMFPAIVTGNQIVAAPKELWLHSSQFRLSSGPHSLDPRRLLWNSRPSYFAPRGLRLFRSSLNENGKCKWNALVASLKATTCMYMWQTGSVCGRPALELFIWCSRRESNVGQRRTAPTPLYHPNSQVAAFVCLLFKTQAPVRMMARWRVVHSAS